MPWLSKGWSCCEEVSLENGERAKTGKWEEKWTPKSKLGKKEETAKVSFGRRRSGTQAISERKRLAHVYSLGFPWKM